MPQVAWADRLTLPPDSTGKATGMVPVAVTGGTLYLPASVMVDASGNTIDSATAAPAGTERGLVTRNIPSGTQPVSLASAVTIGAGAAQIGTVANVGDVDHDAVNTAKVVQTGGNASPNNTPPTAVATGDRVRQWQDLNGAQVIRPRRQVTYRANYRSAARPYSLDFTFTAGSRKQWATIHHAATATKTVRLKRVLIAIRVNSVAGDFAADLVRINTAPATGNPAITPVLADASTAAAETTCLALPTTAGTETGAPFSSQYWRLGATGAGPTTSPVYPHEMIDLLNGRSSENDDESQLPTIRAGVLEGWAVTLDHNAASQINAYVIIEFTEE